MSDQSRLWKATFVLVEVVLLLAIPVLAVRGFDAVLHTTDGRTVDPDLSPTDPGYEAFLEPTPVLAVAGIGDDLQLSWVTVLALGSTEGGGGAVLLVPARTMAPADEPGGFPVQTLAARYAAGGLQALRQGTADLLGIAIGDVVDLAPARLGELLAPVSPLTVANPDDVGDFAVGELSLTAEELPGLLEATDVEQSDLTRLARHEAFWRAWIGAVATSTDPNVVPGETTTGLGRFVRGLAAGPTTYDVPPVTEELQLDATTAFIPDEAAVSDLVEDRVPFPAGSRPGSRLRVRVLDGVGADGFTLAVARDVVRAGGQVVVVGNSDAFDATESRVVYFDGALTEQVEALGAELGYRVEQIEGLNPDDRVDVTVVAGADVLATYGLEPRPAAGGTTDGDDPG